MCMCVSISILLLFSYIHICPLIFFIFMPARQADNSSRLTLRCSELCNGGIKHRPLAQGSDFYFLGHLKHDLLGPCKVSFPC